MATRISPPQHPRVVSHEEWVDARVRLASLDFAEDPDNGSTRVRLQGPASTADVTVTLPASAGTLALTSPKAPPSAAFESANSDFIKDGCS